MANSQIQLSVRKRISSSLSGGRCNFYEADLYRLVPTASAYSTHLEPPLSLSLPLSPSQRHKSTYIAKPQMMKNHLACRLFSRVFIKYLLTDTITTQYCYYWIVRYIPNPIKEEEEE